LTARFRDGAEGQAAFGEGGSLAFGAAPKVFLTSSIIAGISKSPITTSAMFPGTYRVL
jgi:hypothetical protein